jgi:hypothetical protein
VKFISELTRLVTKKRKAAAALLLLLFTAAVTAAVLLLYCGLEPCYGTAQKRQFTLFGIRIMASSRAAEAVLHGRNRVTLTIRLSCC